MSRHGHAMAAAQHMDHVPMVPPSIMKNPEKGVRALRRPGDGWRRHLAWVVLSLAAVGYVDAVTGYEVSVFLLYTVPVALATRRLGTAAGLLTAVAATAVWVLADMRSGHVYSRAWILYVNAFNRMVCFVLAVAAIRYLRARQLALLRQIEAFSGQMAACGQCHRLAGADGYWRSVDDYLREFGGAELHQKVCPDCARRGYARAAYRYSAEQAS